MTAGEGESFTSYFASRRDHVRRIAYLICGDWDRADDLAQTAFLKLYRAWDRIRDQAALDAYVRSCLVRAAVDESRRPWRREHVTEILPETAISEAEVGDLVADRQIFRQALASVPPGQRAVLVLRYYEGLDVAATAAALGCSEGNVKSQTSRGLAALRVAVEGLGVTRGGRHDG